MTNQKAMDVLTKFTLASNGKTILSQLDEYIKAQDKENAVQFIIKNSSCDQNTAIEDNILIGEIEPQAQCNLSSSKIAHNNAIAQEWQNKPKCPTCNSQNLKKISATSKVVNTAIFGLFGTKRHKTFHCSNCGYEW